MKYAIAVDLGASSGKMAIGHLEKEKIVIDEYRNFVNRPVDIGTALYWGVFSLYNCWNRYIIIVIEERSMSWKSSIKI